MSNKKYARRYYLKHRKEIIETYKEWYQRHKEKAKEYRKKWEKEHPNYRKEYEEKHKEYLKEYRRKWREKNKGKIAKQSKVRGRKYRQTDKYKETSQRYRERNRDKINAYYRRYLLHRKWRFIILLGGSCKNCPIKATKNNVCIFDFHHVDRDSKEHKNDWLYKGFEQKINGGKIELLCSNCHRLEHYRK